MERSARISELLLPSPPRTLSYVLILVLTGASAALLGANVDAAISATLLVLVPAVLASLVCPVLARTTGRPYYPRRATVLAALGAAITAVGILAAILLGSVRVEEGKVLYVAVGLVWVINYAAILTLVDNRFPVSLSISSVHPLLALPGLIHATGIGSLSVGLLLWLVLMAPFVLIVRLFDAPLQRNFGISGSELFRVFLDHMTTQSSEAEELLEKVGQPVHAPVGLVAFKRKDGSRKACLVVPGVHPGPFGALGGGDLPAKMRDALRDWEHVLVPHGAADHDLNPVTTQEVERLGHYASELAERVEVSPGGSRFIEHGETVRLGGQLFGPDIVLTYTSWPEAIDDVDQGVGHATELVAQAHGARHALFADCHNSLRASAGAVYPLTPRALEIEACADGVAEACLGGRVPELQVGCAQDRTLGSRHLVGRAGCQVLVVEAGDQTTAYVLWDGNNMVPEATKVIREAVLGVVDEVRVMTTDNHAVNLEGGTYSPVGLRTSHAALARISRETTEQALEDLEPVDAGMAKGHAPDIKVVGFQRTAQLSASVNVMLSIVPELALVCLGLWGLGILSVFLAF